MPKRTDIKSILIIGAGPIVIGQACEFDYSGAQACKALKEEGYRVILVNSNPATIMTDPDLADATYIEPITPEIVEKIIAKERPDALLPTMGGQTGLNTALTLASRGVLDKYNVEMIGARKESIDKAEDRELFRLAMEKIGLECAHAHLAHNMEEAREGLEIIGLPAIIRPSFTLGGTGGGIAYNRDEFFEIVAGGIDASPTNEVLIEESILGWKEFEMEVVRDKNDNCIIICSIENVDPMGIHTGDSITVAPALTLTDKEYQIMRNASIAVLREIGVDTGGSNVQFAVDPKTGRLIIIEMNPRVSRSSALASKATGFPIAKVAAKLAVGYTLDELDNDITGVTPASFEPTIDYVVTKIPRFTFEKFSGTPNTLSTAMKSVGEVMAIGRTFEESFQKALRGLETGLTGINELAIPGADGADRDAAIRKALATPTHDRILTIAQAFREGLSVEEINLACHYDPWFLERIKGLIDDEKDIRKNGLPKRASPLQRLKSRGFSDARLGELSDMTEAEVARRRGRLRVHPVFKRIDTCAAEFPSLTPYMYSTYEGSGIVPGADESDVSDRDKVMILGGGPNRIGQGIEFDYCCVHAAYAMKDAGLESIMVNCNPETVSTDYDTSDRLYFEPLTEEDVLEIIRTEMASGNFLGVIVQFGGQTPLKLAKALEAAGVPILGTSQNAIDIAEDRDRFKQLLRRLKLRQPENGIATSTQGATRIAARIGYPVLLRPSYVLGGRAMEIIHDPMDLERYMTFAVQASGENPVLVDRYLQDAIEVDVDALADGKDVIITGIMEHIEEAGVHSGDSACSLPPRSLSKKVIKDISTQTEKLARALKVVGLMNIQFAVKNGDVYILEVNPRASRTVPFVAKATGIPIAKIAARIMTGEKLSTFKLKSFLADGKQPKHVAIKEAVFPFARFPGVDIILGPEMKSTGEAMGIDADFDRAFAKSQLGGGTRVPVSGTAFISVKERDKAAMVEPGQQLIALGFKLIATRGTAEVLRDAGLECAIVNKVLEGRPHIVDAMKNGEIQLVFNTTEGAEAIRDSFDLRRNALTHKIPYYTTVAGALAATLGIAALKAGDLEVRPLQSYFPDSL
ncbi:MAG: carbamoyl-phosphate synthase large subunit [Rhodospirillales bacterium]|jgi:carbamoyl-phosphate synthase large subunit|nr:carbamoyl-phosphate synthase large subunit [Rhodospirillales bacterium]MBT5113126.1 carbamoyl-phosphate synthase large subunit [Rhodospirillales bacterium]MBT6187679.1 carbamoyl-phosphate synthase large subunit [Rhodospirillales bacterium]MBT6743617.1 carbamoyl-phosphate synthase large subunit [Rhodospirillales bacterium]MBT7644195.1 carbamoyl-phosphate synthase large subunit [Rhodospirillales bacterium]